MSERNLDAKLGDDGFGASKQAGCIFDSLCGIVDAKNKYTMLISMIIQYIP